MQKFPADPACEKATVPVQPNYIFDHLMGTALAGLAGSLGVLTALGDFPKDSKGWVGISLPLVAAFVKGCQSYRGSKTTGPQV